MKIDTDRKLSDQLVEMQVRAALEHVPCGNQEAMALHNALANLWNGYLEISPVTQSFLVGLA
jgi:hypothetical protein